jgi:hypothetical protein
VSSTSITWNVKGSPCKPALLLSASRELSPKTLTQSPYVEGPRVTWHWQKVKNKDYERKEKIEFHPRISRR